MKDKLLKQGSDAARRAIRNYLNDEYDQFFIQAGMSFELLGKARLASIHPSLIIDKDFDSLLHACAAGKHSKRAPWNIKSITATEVLKRCTQLQPELGSLAPRLTLLADCRNSTIHLGEVPAAEVKQIFLCYLAGCSAMAQGLEIKTGEVFGEFDELVSKQLDESVAEIQRVVAEKIARATDNFAIRYAALNPDQLKALITIVDAGYKNNMEKYRDELVACPACGHQAVTTGDFDLDWDIDYERDGSVAGGTPIVTLTPVTLVCNVCGLDLDGASELKAAGLPDSINVEDPDPADFYDPPDDYA